ncbi:MAG: GNAT family N-acetyltransferase [Acidobacteriota bacterium]|nr:GNAT family N-acetyltransferase [Acidobacteriota bacterium]
MRAKYGRALANSITYVACDGDVLCGYLRCREDDGSGVYVYDLLVRKTCRGRGIGRKLMEFVCASYPEEAVYVMSDVDEYYQKQGYRRVGSIFCARFPE